MNAAEVTRSQGDFSRYVEAARAWGLGVSQAHLGAYAAIGRLGEGGAELVFDYLLAHLPEIKTWDRVRRAAASLEASRDAARAQFRIIQGGAHVPAAD
jgi:hypothetical protein